MTRLLRLLSGIRYRGNVCYVVLKHISNNHCRWAEIPSNHYYRHIFLIQLFFFFFSCCRLQQIPILSLIGHGAHSQAKGICRSRTQPGPPPPSDALATLDADLSTHITVDHHHHIGYVCQLSAHVSPLVGRPPQPTTHQRSLALLSSGWCRCAPSRPFIDWVSLSSHIEAADPGEVRIERELQVVEWKLVLLLLIEQQQQRRRGGRWGHSPILVSRRRLFRQWAMPVKSCGASRRHVEPPKAKAVLFHRSSNWH